MSFLPLGKTMKYPKNSNLKMMITQWTWYQDFLKHETETHCPKSWPLDSVFTGFLGLISGLVVNLLTWSSCGNVYNCSTLPQKMKHMWFPPDKLLHVCPITLLYMSYITSIYERVCLKKTSPFHPLSTHHFHHSSSRKILDTASQPHPLPGLSRPGT